MKTVDLSRDPFEASVYFFSEGSKRSLKFFLEQQPQRLHFLTRDRHAHPFIKEATARQWKNFCTLTLLQANQREDYL